MHNVCYYDEGTPKYLQTGKGKEFIAEIIKNLCTSLGVKIIHGAHTTRRVKGKWKI